MDSRMMRMKQVTEYTSLSRGYIYEMINTGDFPKPHKLSAGVSSWQRSEIDDWLDKRIKESNEGNVPPNHNKGNTYAKDKNQKNGR